MKEDAKLFRAREAAQSVMSRLTRPPFKIDDHGQLSLGVVVVRQSSRDSVSLRSATAFDREAFRRIVQEIVEEVIDDVTKESR